MGRASASRRRALSFVAVVSALGLLAAVCITRRHDLERALDAVPPGAFAVLVVLHVLTLVCRSEAWRLTLHAVDGVWLARDAVHGANAAAFLAGSLESHTAMPARIALLGRLTSRAPRPGQIAVADVPIFLLEVCGTAILLAACAAAAGPWPWWSAPLALVIAAGALWGGRVCLSRYGERAPITRGLAVLADRRLRLVLVGVVSAITLLGAARVLVALWACGLGHGAGDVAIVFAALGFFGLLPLGPSASPGATLAVAGGAGVGAALAAGLCISASSIAAVLVYALAVGGLHAGQRAKLRLQTVRRERAELVELGVLGAVEVRRARRQQAELARARVK